MPARFDTIITCEHGGRLVPLGLAPLFDQHEELLDSHRGWDPGALELAERLARRLGAPLHATRTSRLVVDLNRSLHAPDLFSELTRQLPPADRDRILAEHYFPYRNAVETAVAAGVDTATVLHLSIHSFTPDLDPEARDFDLGILFDPERPGEAAFARRLHATLASRAPELAVRDNEPYLGVADGLTTHLRQRFTAERYLGIELEVDQRLPLGDRDRWREVCGEIVEAVAAAVTG